MDIKIEVLEMLSVYCNQSLEKKFNEHIGAQKCL